MKEKKIKNPITGVSITDLTGERFSRLIVLELDIEKTRISKKIHWKCICDCGKKVTVSRNGLMSGKTNSCGCWKSDRVREKNLKDKTGERYGKLVVEQMAYIKNNRTYWDCVCDCGNKKVIASNDLSSGKTTSCGCNLKESRRKRRTQDIAGERFGRLTAVMMVGRNKYGTGIWLCKCDCGNEVKRLYSSLIKGETNSCGCYKAEIVAINKVGNIVNRKFGKLTVLDLIYDTAKTQRNRYEMLAICQCDCGKVVKIKATKIKSGNVKSCGCLRIETIYNNTPDLTGVRFGNLTVQKRVYDIQTSCDVKSGWLCKCDCGNEKIVTSYHLNKGIVKSCGCRLNTKGENNVNWNGGLTPIYIFARQKIEKWRNDSFEDADYTCSISKQIGGNLVVHHIKLFKDIVLETIEELGLDLHTTIEYYSPEERENIAKKVLEIHYRYGLGVVLKKEIHDLFHSIYGKHNTTKEHFEEFKKRYKNKEFESIKTMEKDCS